LIAIASFTVLTPIAMSRTIDTARREQAEEPRARVRRATDDAEMPVQRVSGTAVFLDRGRSTVPLAFGANLEHTTACTGMCSSSRSEPFQSPPSIPRSPHWSTRWSSGATSSPM
jgi:K+ transporter